MFWHYRMIHTWTATSALLGLILKSELWNRMGRPLNFKFGTLLAKNVSGQSPAVTTVGLMALLLSMMSQTKRASIMSSNG
uniref:Uncharacterized protein n=1 Tax=Cannabis sativa TaxID=3483 RepID=A0A803R583_CANSA